MITRFFAVSVNLKNFIPLCEIVRFFLGRLSCETLSDSEKGLFRRQRAAATLEQLMHSFPHSMALFPLFLPLRKTITHSLNF